MKTIVLTGGGTAGHVTPNLNLLPYLKKDFNSIEYIGSKNGIEKQLATSAGLPYHTTTTTKLIRGKKNILKNLKIPFELIRGKKEAIVLLKKIKPNVIFSKGGFVSVPVVLAAKKLKIPVIAHESDLSIGLANKFVSKKCKIVFTSFPQTATKLKNGIYSGPPTKAPLSITKEQAKEKLGIKTTKPIVLVTGGSSGAKALNSKIEAALPWLTKNFFVYHLTGKGNKTNFSSPNYHQAEYSNQMPLLMRASNYAITRGGSNTIFELAINQIPMIIVPLPKGNSRGDQIENAAAFLECGYSITLNQADMSPDSIQKSFQTLQNNEAQIKNAQSKLSATNACKTIASELISTANQTK